MTNYNSETKTKYIFAIILFFLSIAIYYRATAVYFLADDFFYIFNRNNWSYYSPLTHFFYQPITLFVYFLNYFWAGLNPYNYHIFTIILNALNMIIFYFVFAKLLNNYFYSFLIMVIAAVYYFSADNMIWINCTNNVICAFFYALTLLYFIKHKKDQHKRNLILALIFFNLTLFTREMGVSIILIIGLIDLLYFDAYKDKKEFFRNYSIFLLFFALYIVVMAIGPTVRYGRLSFNRGAYTLYLEVKEQIININWFIFRTFIPFSFGSHFKIKFVHTLINFIRFNYVSIILAVLFCFIIINRNYYFGLLWIILTAGPYLILNKYFVFNGDRYFYLPHIGLGFILLACWQETAGLLKSLKLKRIIKYLLFLGLVIYAIASILAIQKRIEWWIKAGQSSKEFLEEFKITFSDIPENTVIFVKDIPRWADNAPNKLIVLITGASFALNLFYDKKNIEVIPYWEDEKHKIDEMKVIAELKKFDNFIFLEYKDKKIIKWQPPDFYIETIKKYFVNFTL